MRVPSPGEELFRQWDERKAFAKRLVRVRICGAGTRRTHPRCSKRLLKTNAGRAREYKLPSRPPLSSKRLVRGVLSQQAPVVGLRSQEPSRRKAVQREIVPLRALQRIVSFVSNVGEPGTAYPGGKRQDRDCTRREF